MIHVSILGATGYVGLELTRLLYSHPSVHIAHLVSHSQAGQTMGSVYPGLSGRELPVLEELDVESLAKDTDVFFTCLPHGASKEVISQLFSTGKYIVDMGITATTTHLSMRPGMASGTAPPNCWPSRFTACPSCTVRPSGKPASSAIPAAIPPAPSWAWPPCSSRAASAPIISSLTPNPAQPARAVASPRPCTSARPTSP